MSITRRVSKSLLVWAVLGVVGLVAGSSAARSQPPRAGARTASLPVPLHTSGRWIVDPAGQRVRLTGVNWYGAESADFAVAGLDHASLPAIVAWIKDNGFNVVRLPWSVQMWHTNPRPRHIDYQLNRGLRGLRARGVFAAVVQALSAQGVMVVLDNHTSGAEWCCSTADGNGLWHTPRYSTARWVAAWKSIVSHFKGDPWVVGAELRNELRADTRDGLTPYWGSSGTADLNRNWHAAAQLAGNAVLSVNRNLLVIVDGLNYATDLQGVYRHPLQLNTRDRVVYAAHDYAQDQSLRSYQAFSSKLGNDWGFILEQGKPFTAPVWVSEFGTCTLPASSACGANAGRYFAYVRRYLQDASIDWAYWPLNGTDATCTSLAPHACAHRGFGARETFGLLDTSWQHTSNPGIVASLQQIGGTTSGCAFSQLCSPAPVENAPGGSPTVQLPQGAGLYVSCYTADGSYFKVSWTSTYHWRYTGYVPAASVQTYGENPAYYWSQCSG